MRWLIRTVDLVSGFLLAVTALVTFGEASLRYLFSLQIPDAYTLSGYAQAIAIFWGISSATYAGRHITVDLLWEAAGPNWKRFIDIFATLCAAAFLGAMAWMLYAKVERSRSSFEITSVLHWPIWPFVVLGALGIGLAFVLALVRAFELSRGAKGGNLGG